MNTRSFIFFTRILARAQISLLIQRAFLLRFYRSRFWRLQKLGGLSEQLWGRFIGHNFGDYKNRFRAWDKWRDSFIGHNFGDYKNLLSMIKNYTRSFIGHDFGDYKKLKWQQSARPLGEPTLYEVKYSGLYFTWKQSPNSSQKLLCNYVLRRSKMLSYVRHYPLAIAKLMCLCFPKIC